MMLSPDTAWVKSASEFGEVAAWLDLAGVSNLHFGDWCCH
jgi:hypothetical protein